MTYRKRREARAERLRVRAAKRQARADADLANARAMASIIPVGQPVLVGHHSERKDRRYRARIDQTFERSFENQNKASDLARLAAGIEAQLDRSIYSDDPDATERLEARVAELEAERARIKAYNASCRKAARTGGVGDTSLLSEKDRADVAELAGLGMLRAGGAFPAYKLTNLSSNIKRYRDRLQQTSAQQKRAEAASHVGGVLVEDVAGGYCRVTFADKPERSLLDDLRAAGFRWGGGSWTGKRDVLPRVVEAASAEGEEGP